MARLRDTAAPATAGAARAVARAVCAPQATGATDVPAIIPWSPLSHTTIVRVRLARSIRCGAARLPRARHSRGAADRPHRAPVAGGESRCWLLELDLWPHRAARGAVSRCLPQYRRRRPGHRAGYGGDSGGGRLCHPGAPPPGGFSPLFPPLPPPPSPATHKPPP